MPLRTIFTNVDPTLTQINVTSKLNICKTVRKTELKVEISHFSSFNIMPYFVYADIISSLLDLRLVDPGSGSSLINGGAYGP